MSNFENIEVRQPSEDGLPSGECHVDVQGRIICDCCDPGWVGDDCSIACAPGGEACEVHSVKIDDDKVAGLTMVGAGSLAKISSGQGVESAFREFIRTHTNLLGSPAGSDPEIFDDGLQYRPNMTETIGGFRRHRFHQKYRNFEIYGSGSEVVVLEAISLGVTAYSGYLVDQRKSYRGLNPDVSGQQAVSFVLNRPEFSEGDVEVENVRLVAVAVQERIGYAMTVLIDGIRTQSVVVAATRENDELVLLASNSLVHQANGDPVPVTVRARPMVDDFLSEPSEAIIWSGTFDPSGPTQLLGSEYLPPICNVGEDLPQSCTNLPEPVCGETKLGGRRVALYPRNRAEFDPEDTDADLTPMGSECLWTTADGVFDEEFVLYESGLAMQEAFHRSSVMTALLDEKKGCTWDHSESGGQLPLDPCTPRPLTIFVDSDTTECGVGGTACVNGGYSPSIWRDDDGKLLKRWVDFGHPNVADDNGVFVNPVVMVIPGMFAMEHEMGHYLDHGTSVGAVSSSLAIPIDSPIYECDDVLDPDWSNDALEIDPETGEVVKKGCCVEDTITESRPLTETIAELTSLYLKRAMFRGVEFTDCDQLGSFQGSARPLVAECFTNPLAIPQEFGDNRPSPWDQGNVGTGCSTGPGYKMGALKEAWWSLLYGKDCIDESGELVPFSQCADILPTRLSNGKSVNPEVLMIESLLFALELMPVGGSTYQQMFDYMGMYTFCSFDQDTFSSYRKTMAAGGMIVPASYSCGDECGNGVQVGEEECDDGNDSNEDFCTNACESAKCGDGYLQEVAGEECDDGNSLSGDGCDLNCNIEGTGGTGGSGGGGGGEPCHDIDNFIGVVSSVDRPLQGEQTLPGAMYTKHCPPEGGNHRTCVWTDVGNYDSDAFQCASCPGNAGCYCESDNDCLSLGSDAKCYGPGLDGPEYGCFRQSEKPDFACEEACHDDGKNLLLEGGRCCHGEHLLYARVCFRPQLLIIWL